MVEKEDREPLPKKGNDGTGRTVVLLDNLDPLLLDGAATFASSCSCKVHRVAGVTDRLSLIISTFCVFHQRMGRFSFSFFFGYVFAGKCSRDLKSSNIRRRRFYPSLAPLLLIVQIRALKRKAVSRLKE